MEDVSKGLLWTIIFNFDIFYQDNYGAKVLLLFVCSAIMNALFRVGV